MMKRFALLACTVLLAVTLGCNGCGDTGSGTTNNTTDNNTATNNSTNNETTNGELPEGCVDADGDGFGVGLTCNGPVDCDDTDPDVHPGAEEVCYDGIDNDCDMSIDEGCPDCEEGATQTCGTDVGRCVSGIQTCEDGVWSTCVGSEGPFGEVCNGLDDNCNGVIDENPELLCDDGVACNGVEICEAGACVPGEEVDCSHLDGPCLEGMCSEKDRGCRAFPKENGSECDDGLFCTENGVCDAGECVTTPRDCSSEEDQCNIGVCDEGADACVKQPKSDGIQCDDGQFCTTQDSCQAGVCTGAMRDCSSAGDQCNEGVCDEQADQCVPSPVNDGTACDDGLYCNVGETCQAGQCTGGSPRSCTAQGGSCRTGVCDEATNSCDGDPVPDGTACDDGRFCTTNDSCVAGTCEGGAPRDCSAVATQCKAGSCNENLKSCVALPRPDGTTCNDGAFCTVGDTCQAGTCSGQMRDCSAVGDACNIGVCDDVADQCMPQPVSDGTGCPDGLFCTQSEVCVSGTCDTQPRDCSGEGDDCNDGICDETNDQCTSQPKPDGTTCNDGLFCTADDSCQSGVCTGGPRSCAALDDTCRVGTCDEDNNTCQAEAVADNTPCDDGAFCTENDLCLGGTCSGSPRNCSSAGDQCNDGICDEAADACVPEPKDDGTACNDGLYCTTPDACLDGVCTGPPRDCSSVGDQCNQPVCDESANTCTTTPAMNGTLCDDGAFCTENDACFDGDCLGDQRDCTAATGGDTCLDGVCDESNDQCTTVDNGTCDTCSTGTPTADAGTDETVIPNTTVQLDGMGSSDPDGQTLSYSWTLTRPSGSSAQLSDPAAAQPSFLADVSGAYEACLVVTDPDGCQSAEDCVTITVEPLVDLHIELVWFSDDSDVDVHYQAPDYSEAKWFAAGACWWGDTNPDWGGGATGDQGDGDPSNDPALDVDNVTGFGPENINQSNLFDGDPFTIGVHYYLNSDSQLQPVTGNVDARIRVYANGALEYERTRSLSCREFWEVAEVQVTGGGTNVNVTTKNSVTTVDTGICRCSSNSDCPTGETCESRRFNPRGGPPVTRDICVQ